MQWAAAWLLLAPASLAAQRGTLAGVIVSHETKEPLAYSVVALPDLGREIFTTDSGAFTDELMESIPVIKRVFTIQRFDTTGRGREYDEVYEDLKLAGIRFIGRKPGQERKSP
jgi:hypothetical protein